MTVKEIHEAAARDAAKFETAARMRELLDALLKQFPGDERSDVEEQVQELVFGEAP